MEAGLSARDTRTLAIGVSVIGTLFGVARGLPALRAWERDRIGDAAAASLQASAARTGVRLLPALRDSLRDREMRLAALDSVLLTGPSPSAAASDLASTLGDMADDAPLKISAMQLRADSAGPGSLTPVAVRVTGVTDIAGLAGFLRAIEGGEVPLLVRELAVSQPEPAAPSGRVESLRVDILVEGIARITSGKHP
ncbi:MAG: GspMb/PilO family protein [bacterium]